MINTNKITMNQQIYNKNKIKINKKKCCKKRKTHKFYKYKKISTIFHCLKLKFKKIINLIIILIMTIIKIRNN